MSLKTTTGFMAELSVYQLLEQFNFYVPEIQREYVWGKNHRNILSSFCDDIILGRKDVPDEKLLQQRITKLAAENKFDEIQKIINEKGAGSSLNIGFLYSYEPNYRLEHFPDTGAFKDTYLIDGQQRFTSLFLILFYLAVKEERKNDFIKLLRYDKVISTVAFDYRVRSLTHDFIIKLINELETENDFSEIVNSVWFIDAYNQDVTISSMVNALKIIKTKFQDEEEQYFDFVLNKIRFWHFKTEKTNQGEELYITMNSRGKQLEENETVRAKLFEAINDESQAYWSEKWEIWQDYFWKNRNGKSNADEGFNEFLKCIAGLQSYLSNNQAFVSDYSSILEEHLTSNLSLEIIESYFDAFTFIEDKRNVFAAKYEYADWVETCTTAFKNLIINENTNWFEDYSDENKATERRRMVFIWSVLLYVAKIDRSKIDLEEIYRFLRIYWLRYNNYDRLVSIIKQRVEQSLNMGVWSESYRPEEIIKHKFYLNLKADENRLQSFESRIWKIEDHRLNLNGYQVDYINCSHLIDFSTLTDFKSLDTIYSKFNSLFPEDDRSYSTKINDILMFYGFYGMRRTPYYYYNYDFSSWRRIIRDLDSVQNVFSTFFKDYDGNNLESLLETKKREFIEKSNFRIDDESKLIICNSLLDTVKLYIILCENIWKNGGFIASEEKWGDVQALTTYEKNLNDSKPFFAVYNTKGNFRGYTYTLLHSLLPQNYLELIRDFA